MRIFSKSILAGLVVVAGAASHARASFITTPVAAEGSYSYSYDPADNGALPAGANPSANITTASAHGLPALVATNANLGTATWDFQTSGNLTFSSFSVQAGGVNFGAGGSSKMEVAYSTDGTGFTTFYNNDGKTGTSDMTQSTGTLAAPAGMTDLYVTFTISDPTGAKNVDFLWGSAGGSRPLVVNATVVPEPASLGLLSLTGLGLLVRRRRA